jgi:hypothetical protein
LTRSQLKWFSGSQGTTLDAFSRLLDPTLDFHLRMIRDHLLQQRTNGLEFRKDQWIVTNGITRGRELRGWRWATMR